MPALAATKDVDARVPDLRYGPEWAVLELIARGAFAAHEQRCLRELLEGNLDHADLFLTALRHGLGPVLAHYADAEPGASPLPEPYRYALRRMLRSNRHQVRLLAAEAERVGDAMARAGIRAACTKGVVLAFEIYEDPGSRVMSDVDFVVAPEDAARAAEVLRGVGYKKGEFDWHAGTCRPLSRQEEATYRLFPDHVPQFIKAVDGPSDPYVIVDVSLSLTWHASPWPLTVDIVFDDPEAVRVADCGGHAIPTLDFRWHFLRVVLHTFRETWLEHWVQRGRDITLRKIADVARLWRLQGERLVSDGFAATVTELGLVDPVLWMLHHVDQVTGTSSAVDIGIGSVSDEWLASHAGRGLAQQQWHGDMRQRLRETSAGLVAQ